MSPWSGCWSYCPRRSRVAERLFFALWPDAPVRAALAGLQNALPLVGGRTRPAHPEDLHLTLAFLGEVAPQQRACCEAAAGTIQASPFALRLDQIGYWPRPRILWCGPQTTPVPLLNLVRCLESALHPCGFAGERRPYAAHLTLARGVAAGTAPPGGWHTDWRVDGFVLAISRPGPPPRYRVLRRWSFTASPASPLCDNARL